MIRLITMARNKGSNPPNFVKDPNILETIWLPWITYLIWIASYPTLSVNCFRLMSCSLDVKSIKDFFSDLGTGEGMYSKHCKCLVLGFSFECLELSVFFYLGNIVMQIRVWKKYINNIRSFSKCKSIYKKLPYFGIRATIFCYELIKHMSSMKCLKQIIHLLICLPFQKTI